MVAPKALVEIALRHYGGEVRMVQVLRAVPRLKLELKWGQAGIYTLCLRTGRILSPKPARLWAVVDVEGAKRLYWRMTGGTPGIASVGISPETSKANEINESRKKEIG